MVARGEAQILQYHGGIKCGEHGARPLYQITGKAFAIFAKNGAGGTSAFGIFDHGICVSFCDTCVNV